MPATESVTLPNGRVSAPSITYANNGDQTTCQNKTATISIKFADAQKGTYVLDVTDAEAEELGQKGRKQARRGRRPKAAQG